MIDKEKLVFCKKLKLAVGKKLIDEACNWMSNIDFEMEYEYFEDGYAFFDADKFIEDFKKIMLSKLNN